MATNELTAPPSPSTVFRQYVLTNLQYWRDYVSTRLKDTAALDCSQNRIVRAISFALELGEAWSTIDELIEAFSAYMERRGHWEVWRWVLTQALEVAQRSNDMAGVVHLSALLARLSLRQNRCKEVITYHRYTIRIARRIGDCYNEARACSNLGYFYVEKGHWRRAEVLCCHALVLFEQLGSQHGLAHTENHLGILYTRQGLWNKAMQHLERACAIWQAMGDDHGLMYGYMNLGMLFTEMARPDEALLRLQKALDQAKLVGEEALIGIIKMNMGISYRLKGEPVKAEEYYWQVETIFQRSLNQVGLAQVYDNLGLVCLDQKKWSEAGLHVETALKAWRSLDYKYNEIQTILYLVEYELARGDPQQADGWLKEASYLLSQYDPGGSYQQLRTRMNKLRRSLTGQVARQTTAR